MLVSCLSHLKLWPEKKFKQQKGMVLPFQPLSMSFNNINYFVDVPLVGIWLLSYSFVFEII